MKDTRINISYDELCQIEGIERQYIVEIVEYGIVKPIEKTVGLSNHEQWLFETSSIHWIKKASRLHLDLEIDWVAVAMVIKLMRQKDALERDNQRVSRLLQRFIEDE